MTEPIADAATETASDEHHVPFWLFMLVVVLAFWVLGLGAYTLSLRSNPSTGQSEADKVRLEAAHSAFESSGGSTAARLELAYAYQRAGDYSAAERSYDEVLRADPKNTAAEYNLGVIDEAKGKAGAAAAHYRKVLAADPGNELAAKQLSLIQYTNEDWQGIIATLKPALRTNPDLSDLHYLLGVAYEKSGQRARAADEYRSALEYYPDMREAQEALARVK